MLRLLKESCPSLTRIALCDSKKGVVAAENILDYSSIKVEKFRRFSKDGVFQKFIFMSFSDTNLQYIVWGNDENDDRDDNGVVNPLEGFLLKALNLKMRVTAMNMKKVIEPTG